jgi:transcription antitermination protein NusB
MGDRRKSREYALQMLFQWDITHDPIERIIVTFWESVETMESPEVMEFANALATGTILKVEKIDALLQRHAENWRLDRMAGVDRNLLRLATYEFLDDAEIPKAVIINEAIEIARRFSTQESPQFINGILDSIRKEVEQ